ncbi:PKD domain-containing protein [Halorussus sp. MSC15.2]|uniref:PKD domain-containing protein n=1 Tax=Halorussus sp. MSC15.2 TaxID=2283638 RepID=UPI0013D4D572|nr:PKD domain-containing protein [Halorussus sp. MSC15.2]
MRDDRKRMVLVLFVAVAFMSLFVWANSARASFDYRPERPTPQQPIVFEAEYSGQNAYLWNMAGKPGDQPDGGWERRGESVSYTFTEPGTYAVTLKVINYGPGPTERKVTKIIHVRTRTATEETMTKTGKGARIAETTSMTSDSKSSRSVGIWPLIKRTDVLLGIVASVLTILLYFSQRD